jgi:hypothetical protein
MEKHYQRISDILNSPQVASNNAKKIVTAYDYYKNCMNDPANLSIDKNEFTNHFISSIIPVFNDLTESDQNEISHLLINDLVQLNQEQYMSGQTFFDMAQYSDDENQLFLTESILKRELANGNLNVHDMVIRSYDVDGEGKNLGFEEIIVNSPNDVFIAEGHEGFYNYSGLINNELENLLETYKSSQKTVDTFLPYEKTNKQYPVISDDLLKDIIATRKRLHDLRNNDSDLHPDLKELDNFLMSQYLIDKQIENKEIDNSDDLVLPLDKNETYADYNYVISKKEQDEARVRMGFIEELYGKDALESKINYSPEFNAVFNPKTVVIDNLLQELVDSPQKEALFLKDSLRIIDLQNEKTNNPSIESETVKKNLQSILEQNIADENKLISSDISQAYFHQDRKNKYVSETLEKQSYEDKYLISKDYQKEAQKEWDRFCEAKGLKPVESFLKMSINMMSHDQNTNMPKAKYFKLSRNGDMHIPKERFFDDNDEIFKMSALNAVRRGWKTVALSPPKTGSYEECETFMRKTMLAMFEAGYEPEQILHTKYKKFGKHKADWNQLKENLWNQFNGLEAGISETLDIQEDESNLDDLTTITPDELEKIRQQELLDEQKLKAASQGIEDPENESDGDEIEQKESTPIPKKQTSAPDDFMNELERKEKEMNQNNSSQSDFLPNVVDIDITPLTDIYKSYFPNRPKLLVEELERMPELSFIYDLQKIHEYNYYNDQMSQNMPEEDTRDIHKEKQYFDKLNHLLDNKIVNIEKLKTYLKEIPNNEKKHYARIMKEYIPEYVGEIFNKVNTNPKNNNPQM